MARLVRITGIHGRPAKHGEIPRAQTGFSSILDFGIYRSHLYCLNMDIGTNRLIGACLRDQRRKAGLNQTDAAQLLNVPQSTISKMESGERSMLLFELFSYAEAFGIEPSELFRTIKVLILHSRTHK